MTFPSEEQYKELGKKFSKTAKEMFEKLDWERHTLVTNGEVEIYFVKNDYNNRPITNEIDFKNKKMFITGTITMQDLKAINKQVEELGWLE